MSEENPIWQQLTALAVGPIIGAMIIVIGRLLFSNGIIPTFTSDWVQSNYDPAATIVFAFSTICAIIWFIITYRWWPQFSPRKETLKARYIWIVLFIPPLLAFVAGLFIGGRDAGPLALIVLPIALFLGMVCSYWVATALSTPENMYHVVPLASLFRR
ncbi:MAG: hypothetical protein AB4057_01215 [Crocosphaera sp.]